MKRKLTAALLLVVALIMTGVIWLLNTESGMRWAWARAQSWTETELSAKSLEGTLAGPLQAQAVKIRVGDTAIEAAQVKLDWQPVALLRGDLSFRQLTGSEINVHLPPDEREDEKQPFGGFKLPLSISLADVRLDDLKVLKGNKILFLMTSGELSARFEQAGIDVAHLAIQGPWGRFSADGLIGTMPAMMVDLQTDWRITTKQLAQPIAGAGSISGTLAEPRFRQRITKPFVAEAEGKLDWQAEPLSWQARLKTGGLHLNQLRSDWRPVTVAGMIAGEGKGSSFTATSDLVIEDSEVGRWGIAGRLQANERWNLEQLELQQVDGPARIQARGAWTPAFDTAGLVQNAQVALDWRDLPWPLRGSDRLVSSPEGKLTASGSLSDYALNASMQLKRRNEPPGRIELKGKGNREQLRAESLQIAWLDGEAAGSGRLGWGDGLDWEANLSGTGFDPAALLPDWSGDIGFAIRGSGTLPPEGALTADITLKSLSGTLRGEALAGNVEAQLTGSRLTLRQMRLQVGTASLDGSGSVGETWNMDWRLKVAQLGSIHAALGGSIRAEGRLDGARRSPRIRLDASAEGLEIQDIQSKAASLNADIDLAGEFPWDARLEITGVKAAGMPPVDRMAVLADGSASDHRIRIEATGDGLFFTQSAAGKFTSGSWRGRLTGGLIRGLPPDTWRQSAPTSLSANSSGVVLETLCWESGDARTCMSVAGRAGKLRLSRFPLTAISPFIRDTGVRIDGLLNADISADFASGYLDAEVAAVDASIRYGEGETDLAFDIETARLVANSRNQGTSATVELTLDRGGRIEAVLQSPRTFPFGPEAPINGNIELSTTRLRWVSLLISDIADPGGQVAGNFQVAGTAGNPRINGSLLLENGSAFVIPAGIRIRPIRLELRATGGSEFILSGEAVSGQGRINLDGVIQRTGKTWKVSATISGEDFEASRLPYARIFVSPDLRFEVIPGLVTVEGQLHIPRADIELRELPRGVERSPDVVVIREDAPTEIEPGWQTRTNVTVTFGDQVRLEGYGFSGRLSGRLAITEQPGQVATANGALRILEGRYEAYGQELTISEGRLLFAESPLGNPAIDLRAIREVEDVIAGIEVTGQLRNPEIRLFSEPPMEESDALSYLLVGRPLNQASRSEGSLLYNAALSLGLRGGNFLAQQIGGRFGIEEVEVERDPQSEAASLVLGTSLSPRLYLQYVVVFAEAVNRIRIRYKLGTNWTLEAESGEQAGTDLFYTIER